MSLYETRDCGHSEIVLAKKCRICEGIAKEKELEDLRWFRDQINSNVIPGEMDGADSAYDLIQRMRTALEHISDPYSPPCCCRDDAESLARHYEDVADAALGKR
jgi:hypothetical protein